MLVTNCWRGNQVNRRNSTRCETDAAIPGQRSTRRARQNVADTNAPSSPVPRSRINIKNKRGDPGAAPFLLSSIDSRGVSARKNSRRKSPNAPHPTLLIPRSVATRDPQLFHGLGWNAVPSPTADFVSCPGPYVIPSRTVPWLSFRRPVPAISSRLLPWRPYAGFPACARSSPGSSAHR